MLKQFRIALLISLIIAACSTPTEAVPTEPAAVSQATTEPAATEVPSAVPTAAPTAAPLVGVSPDECRLPDLVNVDVGVGFPRVGDRMATVGEVEVAVLFVDFEDAPASISPEDALAMISPGAEELYLSMSYGRMQLRFAPNLAWLRFPAGYSDSFLGYDGMQAILQTAMDMVDEDVDFSNAQAVVVLTDPNTSPFSYGPAFTGGEYSGVSLAADGVTIKNGTVSGRDLLYWGSGWLNHEMGHLMGLSDLYLYSSGDAMQFIDDWSLMGLINGSGRELFAWERWQLGWLEDSQVVCMPDGGTAILSAVEIPDNLKMLVVPVDANRAVVIESRRALGYDTAIPEAGVLVYIVDSSIRSGEGALQVQPAANDLMQSPLAAGESLTIEGVTITVVSSDELTDTVEVTIE